MNTIGRIVAIVTFVTTYLMSSAHATELSQAVMLVASDSLRGTPFAQTVVIAAPLPRGGHIGFIVNRPTTLKLATLFPDEAPAREVNEPAYLGGPLAPTAVFALTRNAPADAGTSITLMPGVVAVIDGPSVDRMIGATPNAARYFLGMIAWESNDLEDEVEQGLWEIRPATVESVLPSRSNGLWNSLRGAMAGMGV